MSIALTFLWGATIAIVAAVILGVILDIPLRLSFYYHPLAYLLSGVVVAPVAEEISKPLALGLKNVRKHILELEDGLIYGAVAGLGFSATENLLYGYSFLEEGLLWFLILIILRSIGGCLLHASATAITGYGIGKALLQKTALIRVLPFLFLAMVLHGSYNFLLTFDRIGVIIGVCFAFLIVIISIVIIRKKIVYFDKYVSK
jgi:RsiW-degrading membrane proteinase PrsW (M82 family)